MTMLDSVLVGVQVILHTKTMTNRVLVGVQVIAHNDNVR